MDNQQLLKLLLGVISSLAAGCVYMWRVETSRCAEDRKRMWEAIDILTAQKHNRD